MCRPETDDDAAGRGEKSFKRNKKDDKNCTCCWWWWWSPVILSSSSSSSPVFAVIAVILLLPVLPLKRMLFNAGYTKWFHWLSLLHLCLLITLPRNNNNNNNNNINKFLSKFLAVMGMTVTLGWWASLMYDLVVHGRFAHILHLNMPFTERMVKENDHGRQQAAIAYNEHTLPFILLSHILDTLGHPVLALYYWKVNNWDICRICTWPVLVSAYLLSRTWSLVRSLAVLTLLFLLSICFCLASLGKMRVYPHKLFVSALAGTFLFQPRCSIIVLHGI